MSRVSGSCLRMPYNCLRLVIGKSGFPFESLCMVSREVRDSKDRLLMDLS